MELSETLYERIVKKTEEGNELFDRQLFQDAIVKYREALALIPCPKEEWEASTWVYAAIGDALGEVGDVENCLQCFLSAEKCPDGTVNPYVQLKIGMCLYDLGNLGMAQDYLMRAYILDGEDVFSDIDRKYYDFIKSVI